MPPKQTTVAAYAGSYPFLFISGIIILPIADAVAIPEPESAPKNIHAMILTHPIAPFTKSISAEAKLTIRFAIPPVDIITPASIKNGIAMTVKEKIPL